jgi:hypothetical protein
VIDVRHISVSFSIRKILEDGIAVNSRGEQNRRMNKHGGQERETEERMK